MTKPKQEPKKEPLFVTIVLCMLVGTNFGLAAINGWVISKVEETNRLLSTFQRIDTVKDVSGPGLDPSTYIAKPPDHDKVGDMKVCLSVSNGTCIDWKPFEVNQKPLLFEKDDQSDPNLCNHWKTDCHNSVPGSCDVTCEIKKGDE